MEQPQRDRRAYALAKQFLLSFEDVTPQILERHMLPDERRPGTLAGVYSQLLGSAANRNMAPGVIARAIGGIESLEPLLCGFEPARVVDKYGLDWERLLDDIIGGLQPIGKIRRTSRSLWPLFCRTIVTGARFLVSFSTAEDFFRWLDFFDRDDRARPGLPMLLSYEIDGLGFALACDFLKEMGYVNFGKPDVHLRVIFSVLGLSRTDHDYEVFKSIVRVARSAGTTPYAVDKLFWLIGSGKFYLVDLEIGGHRDEFIAMASERLGLAGD